MTDISQQSQDDPCHCVFPRWVRSQLRLTGIAQEPPFPAVIFVS